MEWSTESIEKVICFAQERPFLFDVSSAELAWTRTKIWCKKLAQETCPSFLTVCHQHKHSAGKCTPVRRAAAAAAAVRRRSFCFWLLSVADAAGVKNVLTMKLGQNAD